MTLSLYTSIAWRDPCALPDACAWAARYGYAAVDLRGSSLHLPLLTARGLAAFGWDMLAPELLDEEGVRRIRALLGQHGLLATALSCYAPLTLPPSAERTACVRSLEAYVRLAARLGVEAVRSIGNSRTPFDGPEVGAAAAFRWNAEGLAAVAPVARAHGVRLLIETNEGTVTESPEDCLRLRDAVGIVLDCANVYLAGRDPLAAVDTLAGAVDVVHVKDVRALAAGDDRPAVASGGGRRFAWTALGAGDLPWGEILRRLQRQGFTGPVVYEYANPFKGGGPVWRDLPPPEEAAANAAAALRRWCADG